MNTHVYTLRKIAGAFTAFVLLCLQVLPAFAAEIQIFSNEQQEENANLLILDFDDTGGEDIILRFGNTLSEELYWDDTNNEFVFTDDLNVQGNVDLNLNELLEARIENLASAPTCDAGSAGRQYHNTTDTFSYVCDGTAWQRIDSTVTNIGGTDSNNFVLDQDDTGGDVSLQFGTTLGETINWDNTNGEFDFSDDINVTGNIVVSGTVDGVDISTLDTTVTDHLDGTANKHDASEIDVETAGNITTVADLETNLGAVDTAFGDRTYTNDNVVTDGESITASIDALDQSVGDIGNTTYTNNNVVTDGETLTASVDALDAALGNQDYTDSLLLTDDQTTTASLEALNVASGNQTYTNDNVVTDGESFTSSLDAVDTAVGDRTYTDDNVLTDGQALTASLDAIDQALVALPADEQSFHVRINTMTVNADGTSNSMNVYTDAETTAGGHEYYIGRTNKVDQQDIELKFKVRLPEDFVDWSATNDLNFFYQTDTALAADNQLDILVEDDDGDDAFTATDGQGLVNTSWTEYTDEFDGAGFDPAAGEYIYVTVKLYATNGDDARAGELVLSYSTQ